MEEIISRKRKWWAVLSYLGILVLFPLTKNRVMILLFFTQSRAWFSFSFVVIEVFIRIAIESKSWLVGGIVYGIGLLYTIYGITNCIRAKKNPLPFIGKIAEKITV